MKCYQKFPLNLPLELLKIIILFENEIETRLEFNQVAEPVLFQ